MGWASAIASVRVLGPGVAAATAVAVLARGSAILVLPAWLSEALVAVALGVVVRSLVSDATAIMPGVRVATTLLLRIGIVMLGAQLSLAAILAIGVPAVVLVLLLMAVAFGVALLAGRLLGVGRRLTLLIAVGTAICGNTAIITTAPVIKAEDREVSYAVAVITLFGTVALFAYPLVGFALSLDERAFGMWAGSAINDTSQVVAAGTAFGSGALTVAAVVKLTRNALMLPVLVAISLLWRRGTSGGSGSVGGTVARAVPLFVIGFLVLASARSTGLVGDDWASILLVAAKALILVALAGIGLSTSLRELATTGPRPFLLGFAVASSIALLSLTLLLTTGVVPA